MKLKRINDACLIYRFKNDFIVVDVFIKHK